MAKKKKYVLVEEQDAVQEGRTGGCMKPILICVLILFAVAIIAPNRGSDTKTSTAKAKASATVKPTATPAPTATPVPDFPAMSIEDAAAALSMYYAGSDFEYISVFEFDGAVSINVKLKPFLTARYAVRDCCIFSLNVSRYLFLHPEVKSLIICYDADGEDKYRLGAAAPILSQGDLMGCVMLLLDEEGTPLQEADQCLARTAAGFLGKQMES